jgi:hypothetical protein
MALSKGYTYDFGSLAKLEDINDLLESENMLFLDGFRQEDHLKANTLGKFMAFRCLATSTQYIVKDDDPTRRVLLPAWSFESLMDFFIQNENVEAGKNKVVVTSEMIKGWVEEASNIYFVSGGLLRHFLKGLEEAKLLADNALTRVPPATALDLMGVFGQQSPSLQVDTVRRAYVKDINNKDNYCNVPWDVIVDSKYIANMLMDRISLTSINAAYTIAREMGGSHHGNVFEFKAHKLAKLGMLKLSVFDYPYKEGATAEELDLSFCKD